MKWALVLGSGHPWDPLAVECYSVDPGAEEYARWFLERRHREHFRRSMLEYLGPEAELPPALRSRRAWADGWTSEPLARFLASKARVAP